MSVKQIDVVSSAKRSVKNQWEIFFKAPFTTVFNNYTIYQKTLNSTKKKEEVVFCLCFFLSKVAF